MSDTPIRKQQKTMAEAASDLRRVLSDLLWEIVDREKLESFLNWAEAKLAKIRW